jgi:hypothetical protein
MHAMSGVVFQWNATAKLPTDKAVTREDAAAAVDAEATCASGEATKPYGGRSGAYMQNVCPNIVQFGQQN